MSHPLDYASAGCDQRAGRRAFWLYTVLTSIFPALGLSILATFLSVMVPRYERIFMDFKMELPEVTKVVLAITRAVPVPAFWLVAWVIPFGVAVVVHRRTPREVGTYVPLLKTLVTMGAWLFVLLILGLVCFLAITSPIMTLIGGMSGGVRS